jgi:sRNA-binding protein
MKNNPNNHKPQKDYEMKPPAERLEVLGQVAGRNVLQLLAVELRAIERRVARVEAENRQLRAKLNPSGEIAGV